MFSKNMLRNNYFIIPIISLLIAQFIKIILIIIKQGNITFGQSIWSVGMPSGHAAFFTALVALIGIKKGINSSIFAIALIFSITYLFDLLLVYNISNNISQIQGSLGHTFPEIIVGILIGLTATLFLSKKN